jgi:hypothetical protein
VHVDAVGNAVEPEDWVAAPIPAGDFGFAVFDGFVKGPTGGLDDAALESFSSDLNRLGIPARR